MGGRIVKIGTALPKYAFGQNEVLEFMGHVHDDPTDFRKLKVLSHMSGIGRRHSVLPDFGMGTEPEFFAPHKPRPDMGQRMQVFKKSALPLAAEAIRSTLLDTGVHINHITHLITVTCTGLHAPGLGPEIIRHFGLKPDIFHTAVNFMGCNAAFYALKIADLIVRDNHNAKVMVVCVELCTLHFQPKGKPDNLLSNTLFSDGAAGVLVESDKENRKGFRIDGFYSELHDEGWEFMGWDLHPLSFEMTLSASVPDLIGQNAAVLMERVANHFNAKTETITRWAVHPGGKKILDAFAAAMGLKNNELAESYGVLKNYGNMSSPTILFVLKQLLESFTDAKESVFAIGFGPGLTIETLKLSYDGQV